MFQSAAQGRTALAHGCSSAQDASGMGPRQGAKPKENAGEPGLSRDERSRRTETPLPITLLEWDRARGRRKKVHRGVIFSFFQ